MRWCKISLLWRVQKNLPLDRPEPVFIGELTLPLLLGRHLLAGAAWLLFRMYGRGKVVGLENVPVKGAVILAANHASNLDPLLGWAVVGTKRTMWGVAKVELWKSPLSAFVMGCVGAIPVRRGMADRSMFRTVLELLSKGEAVGLFPEGTRSLTGQLQVPQAGIGLLVQKSGAVVVPVGISGTYEMLPVGRKRLKRVPLTITFGKPMAFGPDSSREDIAQQIMDAVSELL